MNAYRTLLFTQVPVLMFSHFVFVMSHICVLTSSLCTIDILTQFLCISWTFIHVQVVWYTMGAVPRHFSMLCRYCNAISDIVSFLEEPERGRVKCQHSVQKTLMKSLVKKQETLVREYTLLVCYLQCDWWNLITVFCVLDRVSLMSLTGNDEGVTVHWSVFH